MGQEAQNKPAEQTDKAAEFVKQAKKWLWEQPLSLPHNYKEAYKEANHLINASYCKLEAAMPHITSLLSERDRLKEALQAFVDDDPCSFDHHGYCQAHGGDRCRNENAKQALNQSGQEAEG